MDQVTPTGQVITLVHFVFQVNPERIACMPNMKEFGQTMYHPAVHSTSAPQAVTCPACKATAEYKARMTR